MSAPDAAAQRLTSLVERLGREVAPARALPWEPSGDGPLDPALDQLVYSFLLWDGASGPAAEAMARVRSELVDYNELRACLEREIVSLLGEGYPRAEERAERLRSVLNDIFRAEHALSLVRVSQLPKREARAFLSGLSGMPPFVASRVTLLALGGHAFPCDARLHAALLAEGAVPEGSGPDESGAWLERQIRAGDAAPAYLRMEAWSEGARSPGKPRTRRASGERRKGSAR